MCKNMLGFISKFSGVGIARSLFKGKNGKDGAPGAPASSSAPRGSYVDANGNTVIPSGVSGPSNPSAFPSLGASPGGVSMAGTATPSLFALRSK